MSNNCRFTLGPVCSLHALQCFCVHMNNPVQHLTTASHELQPHMPNSRAKLFVHKGKPSCLMAACKLTAKHPYMHLHVNAAVQVECQHAEEASLLRAVSSGSSSTACCRRCTCS